MESLNKIKIFKSFLSEDEYHRVLHDTLYSSSWKFGWKSTCMPETPPFWSKDFTDDKFYSEHLKSKIEKYTGKKLLLERVYANAKTYGQDGTFHVDRNNKTNELSQFAFCLYISPLQSDDNNMIGGELQFKLPELDNELFEISILHKPNLGVFFPGYLRHRGLAFKRYTHELRICIAWKFDREL